MAIRGLVFADENRRARFLQFAPSLETAEALPKRIEARALGHERVEVRPRLDRLCRYDDHRPKVRAPRAPCRHSSGDAGGIVRLAEQLATIERTHPPGEEHDVDALAEPLFQFLVNAPGRRHAIDDDREPTRAFLDRFLYPSEYLQFVNHKDTPAHWRRVVTLAIYTFLRPGELEALEWGDVNLEHGMINVHQAIDRSRAGVVKQVKTNCPRQVPIEKELLPLLHLMKREAKEMGRGLNARAIDVPPVNRLSKRFRRLLRKAGLTRPDLYARDKTRKNITFYDLRATGITWKAVRGDAPLEIKHDAGHRVFSTTEGYIRTAEQTRRGNFGAPFPPIPLAVHRPPTAGVDWASDWPTKKGGERKCANYNGIPVEPKGIEPSTSCMPCRRSPK